MTRNEAKILLPIIQAYADGETVEVLTGMNEWLECDCPSFAGRAEDYRVKSRVPREWLINTETLLVGAEISQLDKSIPLYKGVVHVREVLEDE